MLWCSGMCADCTLFVDVQCSDEEGCARQLIEEPFDWTSYVDQTARLSKHVAYQGFTVLASASPSPLIVKCQMNA
jgi:hypothetical protein